MMMRAVISRNAPALSAAIVAVSFSGCASPGDPFTLEQFPEARPLGNDEWVENLPPTDDLLTEPDSRDVPPLEVVDGELQLSIEQAVVTAMRNNRALRTEQLQPMIVGTFEQIERARFDPVIAGEVVVLRDRRQQTSPATRDIFDTTSEQQRGEVGIAQEFATGTIVDLSLSHARSESDRVTEQHTPRLGLTLTQALLQGADWNANVASIQQARLDTLASVYQLRAFAETLAADVEIAFWDHLLAAREIEIFESSLELAEQQLDETQRRVAVGTVAETELAAARAEVALRREALINARSTMQQTRLRLLRLVNPDLPGGWDQHVALQGPLEIEPADLEPADEHIELARLMRPELNEARLRLEQNRLEVIQTRNGLLPRLDFFLTLGKSGYADSFARAWQDIDGRGYDLQAGLQFSYPIGNRAADAEYRAARLSRQQAAESLSNLTQLVELDIQLAYVDVQRAREQIQATRVTRELREETLRAETAKFRVGTSTAFLVAQAQANLLESQIAEVRAMVNYRQTLIELYRLEGSLLKRRAIHAPGHHPIRGGERIGG